MSAKKTLTVDLGTTFAMTLRVKDSAGVAIDLTGYTATFTVFEPQYDKRYETASYFVREVMPGVDGMVNINATDEETAKWYAGKNLYTLDLETPTGEVERLLYGSLEGRSPFNG